MSPVASSALMRQTKPKEPSGVSLASKRSSKVGAAADAGDAATVSASPATSEHEAARTDHPRRRFAAEPSAVERRARRNLTLKFSGLSASPEDLRSKFAGLPRTRLRSALHAMTEVGPHGLPHGDLEYSSCLSSPQIPRTVSNRNRAICPVCSKTGATDCMGVEVVVPRRDGGLAERLEQPIERGHGRREPCGSMRLVFACVIPAR